MTRTNRSAVMRLLQWASFLLLIVMLACPANAGQTISKSVNVDPGTSKEKNVGCGFGDLSNDVYELKIELTSKDEIVDSGIDEQASDGVAWKRDDGSKTKFTIAGVDPNKRFWVVIWAEIKPKAGGNGGGGGKIIRWMSVSDVDVDADTDNDSIDNPRKPSESETEDFAEFPGYHAPSTVPGLVIGVNDDHDEFVPATQPWGRDLDNDTADLTKEGTNYGNQSVGLAQIKLKIGVKRAPGTLKIEVPDCLR